MKAIPILLYEQSKSLLFEYYHIKHKILDVFILLLLENIEDEQKINQIYFK